MSLVCMPLCHDPRISNDRVDKRETENPALILAEMSKDMFGIEVDWEWIAEMADYCDWPVSQKTGLGVHGG